MPNRPIPLPGFITDRLTLRERTLADLDACLAMDIDPQVTRFIIGPWNDPIAHRAFIEARIRHVFPPGLGYWSITGTAGFLGWVLLTPLDLKGPEIEIGWRLVRSAWGHGYATEAARPVLDHALRTLALPSVIADIDPANTASIRVATKLGLRPSGPTAYGDRLVMRYATPAPGSSTR